MKKICAFILALVTCLCCAACSKNIPGEIRDSVIGNAASQGLEFELAKDGNSYIFTGRGACQDSKIVIPATYQGKPVTEIGDNALLEDSVSEVVIPASVVHIGEGAFARCKQLTSVTIPNGVTTIGAHAFGQCSKIKSMTLPNSITDIGGHAFQFCTGLTSITIPNSVTNIGGYAFTGAGLTSITIPASVTHIGVGAFQCSLQDIYFGSTMDAWKSTYYGSITGSCTIHCSDGDLIQ